jgi:hypothetical protein
VFADTLEYVDESNCPRFLLCVKLNKYKPKIKKNMKMIKFLLLSVLLSMVSIQSYAYSVKIDGIYYKLKVTGTTKTAAVTYRDQNYNSYSGSVTIPTSITYSDETYIVTEIDGYAFYVCKGLISIEIPGSVTSIGSYAFYGCKGLTSIEIPSSVTSIGSFAFSGCSDLTSIEIPNSVTWIGDHAFYGCSGLTSVVIPNSVTDIGENSFFGCSDLKKVIVPDVAAWCGIKFGNEYSNPLYYAHHLYSDENTEISNLVIPNSVTSIGEYVFCNTSLKSVTIGTGVLSIASSAFANYDSGAKPIKVIWLTNTPPSGLQSAAGKVNYVANDLYLYKYLSNTKIYPLLSSIFEVDGIKYVPVSLSERTCDAIDCIYSETAENINIGETVSYKGINMNVSQVCSYACYQNMNIKDLTISNNGNIGDDAFSGCTGLQTANISNNGNIGDDAFRGCIGLQTAIIKNKGNIGARSFYGCATSPSYSTFDISNTGTISNYAFQGCGMQTATLGEAIPSLGSYVFSGCSNMQSIILPNTVTSIGEYSFSDCSSMTSAKIGSGIQTIPTYAFSGCRMLNDIQLGQNIQMIDTYAFNNCKAIESITIPQSVITINDYVFTGCSGLKNVTMEDRTDDVSLSLGSNGSNPLFFSCPLDEVYIGRNISYNTLSSYGYSPFYRNTSLRSVTITDKETEISANEFYGCTNLKNVSIGNGVTKIDNWAFSGCSNLDYFSFGFTLKTIGKEAFSDCTNVTNLITNAPTPPVCGTQALDDINKWNCKLQVPATTLSQYQAAEQWKEFLFIEENFDAVFKLTYIIDGEVYKSLDIIAGVTISPEILPTKEGYTFSGWSEIPATMPAEDVVVTGTFSVNSYKLTYMVDSEEYKSYVIEYGSTITPESEPKKEGYIFSGWSIIPATMPAEDVVVTGTFSVNSYKLTYMVDGKEYKSSDVEYGSTVTPETAPIKKGYTFSGWSEIPATMPAKDVVVTGTFSVNSYKLTYMVDDKEYKSYEIEYRSSITPEPEPTMEGYIFSGWSEIPETMPAEDVVVTGTFTLDTTGIDDVYSNDDNKEYYTVDGVRIAQPNKGINIVKMSDGSIKKIFVK